MVFIGAAAGLYSVIGWGVGHFGQGAHIAEVREIEVSLQAPPPRSDTPPPPAIKRPPVVKSSTPPPVVAPPPPPPPLAPPTEMVATKLEEAEPVPLQEPAAPAGPVDEGAVAVAAAAPVVEAAPPPPAPPPPPPPPAPKVKRGMPTDMPEEAEPPEPDDGNMPPEYPEEMRVKGVQSDVILKVGIGLEGSIVSIAVLRGEEPFVGAAVAAVKGWHYAPATLDGEPIAVFKIVKVPFRIKAP